MEPRSLREWLADAGLGLTLRVGASADAETQLEGRARRGDRALPVEQLGRYPITGHLGMGGMGEVIEVKDPDLGRTIAAKVIRGEADLRRIEKFVLEAQVTGQLQHPSIVPVHELGLDPGGRVYFTMKKVAGQTLAAILEREQAQGIWRLAEHLQVFLKVCEAMAFAHSRGVIHRDLKPANVMVGRFGEVQVMDWGLAKVVGAPDPAGQGVLLDLGSGGLAAALRDGEAAPLRTQEGAIVGTPAYMPPEQARGALDEIDARSDIWSLGAILYELLTGHPPYEGSSAVQVLQQILAAPPARPSRRSPERRIPWELEAVVRQAMDPVRERRYPSGWCPACSASPILTLAGGSWQTCGPASRRPPRCGSARSSATATPGRRRRQRSAPIRRIGA